MNRKPKCKQQNLILLGENIGTLGKKVENFHDWD